MDLTKFIVPITLENTNEKQENGDRRFRTQELVYLDDKSAVEGRDSEERVCYPTDYAVMNGVLMSNNDEGTEDRKSCCPWLRSADSDQSVDCLSLDGYLSTSIISDPSGASCPALQLNLASVISARSASRDIFKSGEYKVGRKVKYHTIEFGEFPKTYVGERLNKELEKLYSLSSLKSTGKKYIGRIDNNGELTSHSEFEYEGQKYVRVLTQKCDDGSEYSDGTKAPEDGTYLWVKVEPIIWKIRNWDKLPKEINPKGSGKAKFIDVRTEEAIMSGVPFYLDCNDENCSMWQNSILRAYLNGYNSRAEINKGNGNKDYKAPKNFDFTSSNFLSEAFDIELNNLRVIKDEKNIEKGVQQPMVRKSRLEKLNPDDTPAASRRRMTDTEIIKTWIDAGQSVLLRGPSGIGKTERIKKLYPDLIYIKLTNNMFPEKVVGSMNLQTGEAIPPDFAKVALMACATEEEKKLIKENIQNLFEVADAIYERSKTAKGRVVILLDELLNVKPAVQSLVYTLVLNKLVETGKGLKLPANTVVVATGNQKKYSAVAQDLAEPLEKRFDHILDMEPKVSEWIYEYAIPNKIHPSVIGYIFMKYQENRRSEEIEDIGYFYEEPEVGEENLDRNGCRGRTNDPRGWVSISNTLYAFEEDLENGKFLGKNVEDLLKVTISSKLREEWAGEFYDFYNNPTLTVDEVVNNRYTQSDLPRDINEKFAYMSALLVADEKQVGVCREFIRKYCDPEYLSVYDIYWAGNDEKRMEILVELGASQVEDETYSISIPNFSQNKKKFVLTLKEFFDNEEDLAIAVRNDDEEMLIRKAFDKYGKTWSSDDSYLDEEDDSISDVLYFCNDCTYLNKATTKRELREWGYTKDKTYNIEDVDLTPYLKGDDLEEFKEICKEHSKNNDQNDEFTM